jgi:hypothetical protein
MQRVAVVPIQMAMPTKSWADSTKCLTFCEDIMAMFEEDASLPKRIIFSDKWLFIYLGMIVDNRPNMES